MHAVEQSFSPEGKERGLATYTKSLAAVSGSAKAAPGRLYAVQGDNNNAAVRYLQLHNKASAPSATEVPLFVFRVKATDSIMLGGDFFTQNGQYFDVGIAWGWSTTRDTYTAATAADHATQLLTK